MTLRFAALACALALLAGCAGGRKPYANDLEKNVAVRPALSKVRATMHVHSVDAQCRTQYLGTLDLDRPSVAVGIPADRWSYLVFDFASSGFLSGSRSMSRETLLRPRASYRYEIDATYRDDIYNVVLREKLPNGASRELPLLDLSTCQLRSSRPSP